MLSELYTLALRISSELERPITLVDLVGPALDPGSRDHRLQLIRELRSAR